METISIPHCYTCKYCNEPENKQDQPGLVCDTCNLFVHLKCLKREGTPGDFACDVFFDFTCAECSPDSQEVFRRNKLSWINCLLLTLNHLNSFMQGISNNGFFHYKMHICCFVDRYWVQLFGNNFKQKKNWIGTIAGALSVYNNMFFQSGSLVLGESGWWKLQHFFSPAVAAQIIQELELRRPKGRRNAFALDKNLFIERITEMGYKDLYNDSPERPLSSTDEVPNKKRRISAMSTEDDLKREFLDETFEKEFNNSLTSVTANDINSVENINSIFEDFQYTPKYVPPSESSSISNKLHYDSDSRSSHNHTDEEKPKKSETKTRKTEEKPVFRTQSLFSSLPNSTDMPWVEKVPEKTYLVPMTEYEEIQLLKNVENLVTKVKDPNKKAELYRLRAKLSLRRLKRHRHLPIFDLDNTVKVLGGYVTEDSRVVMNAERILDRFQRSYLIDNLCGTISSTNYGTLLLSHIEPTAFRSAYSGTILKPFIRRDATSVPTRLKLIDELLRKTHRNRKDYEPPPRATIDYSYVRPQHIAAINNLCAQFFWPGIDVTEALQYPEFSCVVTYKRLVIAFAFLVPDVGHNEAYISFVLTRPEWRNARIASFMLYHLLQTCTDKDVTLHVSPNNPAIFLYQKFGFKVEELIQDFYEKYYDIDYKGCRHALFLRLVR